jgi:hypothetical protein
LSLWASLPVNARFLFALSLFWGLFGD